MVIHRLTRWLLVSLVALLAVPAQAAAPLLALDATPASGDTQLYIGHAARLTAQVPARWAPIPDAGYTYGDGDGLFGSQPLVARTLAEACDAASFDPAIEEITFTDTTWNGEPACEIESTRSLIDRLPVRGLILPHPAPFNFQGETISFVAVFVTPDHFDTIIPTVSFHVSALSTSQVVHSVLDIVEVNSYFADEVDWEALHAAADELGPMGDVGRFIEFQLIPALRAAGDNHSFLMPNIDPGAGGSPFGSFPSGEMRGDLGYIEIPSTGLPGEMVPYIESGVELVEELAPQACGWIVDLRSNTGGGVPPMVYPLLPFFPEGRLFGFEDASGDHSWVVKDGNRMVMEREEQGIQYGPTLESPLPDLPDPDAPVAVLISSRTASAGEYTLLTLMGRENTRTFGQPTGGFTTGNAGFTMLDGSLLALAGAAALDTGGNVYTGKIQPDEWIASQSVGGNAQGMDGTIVAAEKWLLEQPTCRESATPSASPAP